MMKLAAVAVLSLAASCGNSKSEQGKGDKPSGKARDMVAERAAMDGFKKRACECTDRACGDKVAEDLKAYMMTDRGDAPSQSKEEMDKDLAVMTEFIGCLDKARGVQR